MTSSIIDYEWFRFVVSAQGATQASPLHSTPPPPLRVICDGDYVGSTKNCGLRLKNIRVGAGTLASPLSGVSFPFTPILGGIDDVYKLDTSSLQVLA